MQAWWGSFSTSFPHLCVLTVLLYQTRLFISGRVKSLHFVFCAPTAHCLGESETRSSDVSNRLTARQEPVCPSHVSHPAQCKPGGNRHRSFCAFLFSLALDLSIPSCLASVHNTLDQTHIWQGNITREETSHHAPNSLFCPCRCLSPYCPVALPRPRPARPGLDPRLTADPMHA